MEFPKPVKVILDIDGVMVTEPIWKKVPYKDDGFSEFNTNSCVNLQRIISETKATLILSSSHGPTFNDEKWISIFKNRGIQIDTIEFVKRLSSNPVSNIIEWVSTNPGADFVVLDDDKRLNDLPATIKKRCVIMDGMIGLNWEATNKAISILKS
jgi:hypothetical protein